MRGCGGNCAHAVIKTIDSSIAGLVSVADIWTGVRRLLNSAFMKALSTYLALCMLAPMVVQAQADLVLTNGRIYTVDNARPIVTAMAVRDGRVMFIGSDAEARALETSSTRMVDLHGSPVYPGFTDAHAHLLGLGTMLQRVNLAGSASYDEVIARVKSFVKEVKPGQWIQGRGWDQNRWPVKDFPTQDA